jgi:hypothetical protein
MNFHVTCSLINLYNKCFHSTEWRKNQIRKINCSSNMRNCINTINIISKVKTNCSITEQNIDSLWCKKHWWWHNNSTCEKLWHTDSENSESWISLILLYTCSTFDDKCRSVPSSQHTSFKISLSNVGLYKSLSTKWINYGHVNSVFFFGLTNDIKAIHPAQVHDRWYYVGYLPSSRIHNTWYL